MKYAFLATVIFSGAHSQIAHAFGDSVSYDIPTFLKTVQYDRQNIINFFEMPHPELADGNCIANFLNSANHRTRSAVGDVIYGAQVFDKGSEGYKTIVYYSIRGSKDVTSTSFSCLKK